MKFQITQIEFDFTYDYDDELDLESQDEIYDEVLNTIYEVDDEENLVNHISDSTGWCIKSISYEKIV